VSAGCGRGRNRAGAGRESARAGCGGLRTRLGLRGLGVVSRFVIGYRRPSGRAGPDRDLPLNQ